MNMKKKNSFVWSDNAEPHKQRTKEIIKQHPEIRSLIGRNPYTFLIILFCVSLQILLAYFLRDQSWWLIFGAAYLIGAFACHTLFVCIHECAHNLVFKKSSLNIIAGIIANLPMVLPSSVSFKKYHIKHHSFQGVPELDADLPDYWEARLINNSTIGKAFWLLIFPVFQVIRTFRTKEIKPVDGWIITNWIIQLSFNAAIWIFFGPKALIFMLASFFFSVGLHPLGARWIQEHFLTVDENQETYSYYGPLNTVAFNVGFHNEHHDFPSIPWNRLPQLKAQAPAFYDSLHSHNSWTKLWLRFLFDSKISLFSRTMRNERGKVALTDESKPDLELSNQRL